MTARVGIENDVARQTINITAARDNMVFFYGPNGFEFYPIEPGTVPPVSFIIPDDIGRALYEALADHYGHGSNDVRALRRDYEVAQRRIDKFIDHLLKD